MPTSKRPAKAPTLPAPKKACTEDSQGDLAKQAASVSEDTAIVFAAAKPYEHLPMISRYIKLRQQEETSLTFVVASTAYNCIHVASEVGATFPKCFQYDKQHKRITTMLLQGASVTTTCTTVMFEKMTLGVQREANKTHKREGSEAEILNPMLYFQSTILRMVDGTKCKTIRFVLDDLPNALCHGLPKGVAAMREAANPNKVIVTGLASAPVDDKALQVLTGCSRTSVFECGESEARHQVSIGTLTTVPLRPPRDDEADMKAMQTLIVGAMLAKESTIHARASLEHATSKVVAGIAHSKLPAFLCGLESLLMYKFNQNGKLTGSLSMRHPALLIAHSTMSGANAALIEMENDTSKSYSHHDLRHSKTAPLNRAIASFAEAFRGQVHPSLAVINPTFKQESELLRKSVTGIVAVGCKWTTDGLKKLTDQFARPSKYEEGDIKPKEFTVVHLDSEWQRSVLSIRSADISSRHPDARLSDELAKKLDAVLAVRDDRSIEANTYRLAAADARKLLGESTMCSDYLDTLLDSDKQAALLDEFKDTHEKLITYKTSTEATLEIE